MATNRPFARNLGSNIPGTEQFGNLAVGEPTSGYQETGLDWWGGPDEDLGYIIATENPLGQSGANEQTAYVTFWRCESSDAAFIALGNGLLDSSYINANDVKTALNSAGYWTSYGLGSGTPVSGFTITIDEVGNDVVLQFEGSLNTNDLTLYSTGETLYGSGLGIPSATFISGGNGGTYDLYDGIDIAPENLGTGSGMPPTSSTGSVFGVVTLSSPLDPRKLLVPSGYTSGSQISGSMTFANTTLAALGLVDGTYTYSWGSGANAESFGIVIGSGAGSETGGGGTVGTGEWYFYSDEGMLNVGPPENNGNIIFLQNPGSGETFNPNIATDLYLNQNDATGASYATQFQSLVNSGGTITLTQNGNTATFSGNGSSTDFILSNGGTGNPFLWIKSTATQTQEAANAFNQNDPISITVTI